MVNQAINPRTGKVIFPKNNVLSYGFDQSQNKELMEKLPPQYMLIECDCFSDLLALPSVCCFVNPTILLKEELAELLEMRLEEL